MSETKEVTLRELTEAANLLRGYYPVDQYRNIMLGFIFLKAVTSASRNHEARDTVWVSPSDITWADLVTEPTLQNVRLACKAFDEHDGNQVFDKPFERLGLCNVELREDVYDAIIHIINRLDPKMAFSAVVNGWETRFGEFTTRESVSQLMVELLQLEPNRTVYDPACGEGGTLLTVLSHGSINSPEDIALYGQDISPEAVTVARMRFALQGIAPENLRLGDTLINPRFTDGGGLIRFDYVVSSPPLGIVIQEEAANILESDPYARFPFGMPRNADFLFVQHTLASLNDDGRAVIEVQHGVLFRRGAEGIIRQRLIEEDWIEAVISLPARLRTGTSIPPVLLVLNKNRQAKLRNHVLFVYADQEYVDESAKQRVLAEANRRRIVAAVKEAKEDRLFSTLVPIARIAKEEYRLTPAAYMDFANIRTFLGGAFHWENLADIAEILRGSLPTSYRRNEGSTVCVAPRDLLQARIELSDLDKVAVADDADGQVYAQAGDILLRDIGPEPIARLVSEELEGALVANNLYVLRLGKEYDILRIYLTEFLNSERGRAYLSTKMSGGPVPRIPPSELRRLRIPVPEKSVLEIIDDVHRAEKKLLERIERARNIRSQLFGIEDVEKANIQLQELGVEAKVLDETVIQADDLDFRIRNFYPYPLAYPYRTLNAIHRPEALYPEQLRVAENLLVFLASIGLAMAVHVGITDEQSGLSRHNLLDYWRGGISPGDWLAVGKNCASILRERRDTIAAGAFGDMWFRGRGNKESEFARDLRSLVEAKNDYKHDRGPKSDYEYIVASGNLRTVLDRCLKHVAFLVQHPIRNVQDLNVDWRSNRPLLETLVYVGDHPGLRQEAVTYREPLPKNHLFMELSGEDWVSLYPLISVQHCPSCGTRETYFVDYLNGPNDRVVIKSFERGHTHEADETAERVGTDMGFWLDNLPS